MTPYNMERIKFDAYEQGAEIPELQVGPVTHMDLVRYSGASGDFNPIHTDPDYAKEAGLPGTIAHGMYVMAQLGRVATNWAPPNQIESFGVKFKGMTLPGETVSCSGKVKRKKEADGKKLLTVALEAKGPDGKARVAGEIVVACD